MRLLLLILQIFLTTNFVKSSSVQFADSNSTYCQKGQCIKKCCPENLFVLRGRKKQCVSFTKQKLEIALPIYDDHIRGVGKSLKDVFMFEGNAFRNDTFKKRAYEVLTAGFNAYLTESGLLYLEYPNAFERWLPLETENYCLDFFIRNETPSFGVWGRFDNKPMPQGNGYFTTGMIISCVFLVLVLIVYGLLPELRNIGGLILMAYDLSLLFAFIFLMVQQRPGHTIESCINYTMVVYYFFLATFCWMNIMSYDIWWTFRGYAKARPIHRRGEKFKFAMYSIYAWGLPLLMTIGLYLLNSMDLRHVPWFITPKIPQRGCFLEGGEKLLYLYTPMLIMTVFNWLFFLMTAFNIWRLGRGTAVLNSAAAGTPDSRRTHRHRLLIYLKLSVLMGLNWILEVVSSFKPDLNIWYVTDTFNLLLGFSIFLIFVCKKKILKKLIKRFRGFRRPKWHPSSVYSRSSRSNSSTESSVITQDTPLQVCINPKGP